MYILLLAANSYAKHIVSAQFKLKREREEGKNFAFMRQIKSTFCGSGAINDTDEYDKTHQNVLARTLRVG